MPFQTILAPVDFSAASEESLRRASQVARALSAKLVVLHAEPLEAPAYFSPENMAIEQAELYPGFLKELRVFAAPAIGSESGAELRISDREAGEAILTDAADAPETLIVMGTHGRTGLHELLYGSVTRRVMEQAGAVLAVCAHAGEGLKLVAQSESPSTRELARTLGAELTLCGECSTPAELLRFARQRGAGLAYWSNPVTSS